MSSGKNAGLLPNRRELFESLGAGIAFPLVLEGSAQPLLGSRLHISPDGIVTLLTGKIEVGQENLTLLAQCVAEELRVDISKVRVVAGDTALVPDDGGTFASLTTPLAVPVVRQAAAAAREMLRTMTPGEAELREIPVKVDLTPPERWKVLGISVKNLRGREIVTGALKYSSDIKLPGMLAGKVVRPEAYSAELVSFDAAEAERLPGVKVVKEGSFLGVVAQHEAAADEAVELVKAEWNAETLIALPELFEHLKKTSVLPKANLNARYPPLLEKGAVREALIRADKRHEASYTLPPIAHVPLEPRAAVALWDKQGLTVHSGVQVPFGVRKQLADTFGIPENRVRVIIPAVGSSFGGKHGPEVMIEAARLAKAAGKPVRVAWSREEEFVRSYCRPPGIVEVRSGIAKDGRILAWEFHNYNSGAASLTPPYAIPDYWCGFHRSASPFRQGSYRSLAAVANAFARESHVDELASLASQDAVEFRLRNLENPRMREVVQRAAERFGWGKNQSAAGMACNLEKDGHMALFVELEARHNSVRLIRMVIAFDCGAVLNPGNLRNQIAGAVIQGIGGALFEQLRYDGRKVLNSQLSGYRVPRFSDVPPIDIVLVDRREVTPAGAGESPITVVAPAIAAALFRATGHRRRSLPLAPA